MELIKLYILIIFAVTVHSSARARLSDQSHRHLQQCSQRCKKGSEDGTVRNNGKSGEKCQDDCLTTKEVASGRYPNWKCGLCAATDQRRGSTCPSASGFVCKLESNKMLVEGRYVQKTEKPFGCDDDCVRVDKVASLLIDGFSCGRCRT